MPNKSRKILKILSIRRFIEWTERGGTEVVWIEKIQRLAIETILVELEVEYVALSTESSRQTRIW